MRNMRQFMSGMKNYLVKHGERGFEREVEKERSKVRILSNIKEYSTDLALDLCYAVVVCSILFFCCCNQEILKFVPFSRRKLKQF